MKFWLFLRVLEGIRTGSYSHTHTHTNKSLFGILFQYDEYLPLTYLCMRDIQAETAAHICSSQSVYLTFKCTCNPILTTHHSLGMFCACVTAVAYTMNFTIYLQLLHISVISYVLLQTKLDLNSYPSSYHNKQF